MRRLSHPKFFFLLALFTLSAAHSYSQKDTVRKYYQNGQVYSEMPLGEDGRITGVVRHYHLDGTLRSIRHYTDSGRSYFFSEFYRNGVKKTERHGLNSGAVRKEYDSTGILIREEISHPGHLEITTWYKDGALQTWDLYRNGKQIYCIIWDPNDPVYNNPKGLESCYNENGVVKWQDSLYVDEKGIPVNQGFQWYHKSFYATGNLQQEYAQDGISLRKREWDISGSVVMDTLTSIRVPPVIQESVEGVAISMEPGLGEGGPLLDTPYPLRDTLIQKYSLKTLTDSTVLLHLDEVYHDSLGQQSFHGFDVICVRVKDASGSDHPAMRRHDRYETYSLGSGLYLRVDLPDRKEILLYATGDFRWDFFQYNRPIRLSE